MKMMGVPETNQGPAMSRGLVVSQGLAAIQGVVKSKVVRMRFAGSLDMD